ncbi:uncharacterized protein UDID_17397 [Ustilago sp. UG-2017a]|nr:uncharacterized protein UDID_17397 [Ustilago sp. UG-2017a]
MVPTASGNGNYLFIIDAGKFARRNVPRYERRLLPSTLRSVCDSAALTRRTESRSHVTTGMHNLVCLRPTLRPQQRNYTAKDATSVDQGSSILVSHTELESRKRIISLMTSSHSGSCTDEAGMVTDTLYDEASGRISPAKQRGANDNGPCCKPEMFCFFIRSSPNVGKTPLLLVPYLASGFSVQRSTPRLIAAARYGADSQYLRLR